MMMIHQQSAESAHTQHTKNKGAEEMMMDWYQRANLQSKNMYEKRVHTVRYN